ncbi:uncharacterized protein LOC117576533 [Drosophila albomicans]|uniref:Uncharacterized protein LOC117576533 n=1 Tax=Drosophila albomicans TaxID=7291 RepID=A0A6P8XV29_DROAB|nr:uncharacterized protein LOC117576533 [Drosophila albomicans]
MAETRVVVQLTENHGSDQENAASIADDFPFGGELNVLDKKTLRLLCCQNATKPQVMVAQKLRFDALYVNNNEEHKLRELNTLLNNLFEEQRDCLLLHLTAQRGYNLMLLVDTLIVQINVKLQQLCLKLERCDMHYRHIAEGNSCNPLDAHCVFQDTKQLMAWLLNEYRLRTSLAQGHEAFQVEYSVVHPEQGYRFSVNLHIVLVAMEELCRGTLCSFRCYFSNDPISAALSITELTSYVRHAGEQVADKPLYLLMLCHVLVTDSKINCNHVQMLGLANLACKHEQDQQKDHYEPLAITSISSHNPLLQFEQLSNSLKEVNDCFKLVQGFMLQYQEQEQQLQDIRLSFNQECSNFVPALLASKEQLLQVVNSITQQ